MKSKYATRYPKELRERVLSLSAQGMEARDVADATGVSQTTIHYWRRLYGVTPTKKEPEKKQGSGVIAPSPYVRGYRWGAQ